MKEGAVHHEMALPAHDQAAAISEPRKGPFNLPPASVASQLAPVLPWRLHAVAAMRAHQLDPASGQSPPQRSGVAGVVVNDPCRLLPWASRAMAGHRNRLQGWLQQGYFGWGGRVQEMSQRTTLAVDHHHPLRTRTARGLSDAEPPCFAGATRPSANVSAPSSWPCASRWATKVRQVFSHTPCSSHSRRRRQQVLAEGNRAGRSCHRAPLRKPQKMPSKTGRFGIGFGPPRGDACGSGSKGALCAHWRSVSSECSLAIGRTPFAVL